MTFVISLLISYTELLTLNVVLCLCCMELSQSNGENRFYMFLQPPPTADEDNSYSISLSEVIVPLSL